MKDHVSTDDLYDLAFDGTASPLVTEHVAACDRCRQELEALRSLAHELEIARRSTPEPLHLDAYRAMFKHVQAQPSPLQRILNQIRATLAWDSRRQPTPQGVRGLEMNSYR